LLCSILLLFLGLGFWNAKHFNERGTGAKTPIATTETSRSDKIRRSNLIEHETADVNSGNTTKDYKRVVLYFY
jgi:hypothetical protein